MPIQVYVDDSGGIGQGPVFVMAGLLGWSEYWAQFSEAWKKVLDTPPRLGRFKMHDAAKLTGDFYGFLPEQRDAKLIELLRVIDAHELALISVILDLSAFGDTIRRNTSKPNNNPYFTGYCMMVMAAAYELLAGDWNERFEIIFDENEQLAPHMKRWYPVVRSVVEPAVHNILPVDPLFRADDEFLPLQACDLFAWWTRRFHDQVPKGLYPDFTWMLDYVPRLRHSEHSQYVDRKRMEGIVQDAYNKSYQVPPLIKKEMRQMLGESEADQK